MWPGRARHHRDRSVWPVWKCAICSFVSIRSAWIGVAGTKCTENTSNKKLSSNIYKKRKFLFFVFYTHITPLPPFSHESAHGITHCTRTAHVEVKFGASTVQILHMFTTHVYYTSHHHHRQATHCRVVQTTPAGPNFVTPENNRPHSGKNTHFKLDIISLIRLWIKNTRKKMFWGILYVAYFGASSVLFPRRNSELWQNSEHRLISEHWLCSCACVSALEQSTALD